jgi:hypothetical protein
MGRFCLQPIGDLQTELFYFIPIAIGIVDWLLAVWKANRTPGQFTK